ncbi:hypothetical protein D7D52_24550 [Nocardia yunnanensis]|uniref:Secreted protein n=1 Tax=Nocardia yunnanensis TaxID=2382165 RepID=A0A386ZPR6_9NOCA|nr:hypothetical protein [Nocardia yunnanensis]AYF79353.1 hypothetical protein D7D52_24550 [Nocardia yunnanensis]
MSGTAWGVVIIVLVVVIVLLIVAALLPRMRSRRLKERFGPEYDRTLEQAPNRKAAEQDLAERQKRHEQLQLRELSDEEKRRYQADWTHIQERFIDDPAGALGAADHLVTKAMADRGYPNDSYDQRLADLSVEHARPLGRFRAAHDIASRAGRGGASTEDMRTAIVDYRELFTDLLDGGHSGTAQHN